MEEKVLTSIFAIHNIKVKQSVLKPKLFAWISFFLIFPDYSLYFRIKGKLAANNYIKPKPLSYLLHNVGHIHVTGFF